MKDWVTIQGLVFSLSLSLFFISIYSSIMTTVVLSSMWSAALLLLLLAVSHVRLQCDSGATFRAHCTGVSRRCKLYNARSLGVDEPHLLEGAGKSSSAPGSQMMYLFFLSLQPFYSMRV